MSVYDARSDALASAEGFFRELRESERRLSQELVVAGDRVRRQGDLAGALDLLDRAVALCDTNADAFLFRGIARGALGDSAGAYSDLARAAELEPSELVPYAEVERLLAEEGRWADAVACWELYLLDNPQDPKARERRDQSRARSPIETPASSPAQVSTCRLSTVVFSEAAMSACAPMMSSPDRTIATPAAAAAAVMAASAIPALRAKPPSRALASSISEDSRPKPRAPASPTPSSSART